MDEHAHEPDREPSGHCRRRDDRTAALMPTSQHARSNQGHGNVNPGESEDLERALHLLQPPMVMVPCPPVQCAIEPRWLIDRRDECERAERRERCAHRRRADDAWTMDEVHARLSCTARASPSDARMCYSVI